jgi:uncharacterized protein (UPF0254 family)
MVLPLPLRRRPQRRIFDDFFLANIVGIEKLLGLKPPSPSPE